MGLSRAFTQTVAPPTVVASNQFPNTSTIWDLQISTAPSTPIVARPNLNRRGLLFDNDGTLPVIFAYGTSVSFSSRTGILFSNDFYEDLSGWQGPVTVASVGGNGAINITEIVFI
jgi:hypothetical protein